CLEQPSGGCPIEPVTVTTTCGLARRSLQPAAVSNQRRRPRPPSPTTQSEIRTRHPGRLITNCSGAGHTPFVWANHASRSAGEPGQRVNARFIAQTSSVVRCKRSISFSSVVSGRSAPYRAWLEPPVLIQGSAGLAQGRKEIRRVDSVAEGSERHPVLTLRG